MVPTKRAQQQDYYPKRGRALALVWNIPTRAQLAPVQDLDWGLNERVRSGPGMVVAVAAVFIEPEVLTLGLVVVLAV